MIVATLAVMLHGTVTPLYARQLPRQSPRTGRRIAEPLCGSHAIPAVNHTDASALKL
jgi:hypothetical protein